MNKSSGKKHSATNPKKYNSSTRPSWIPWVLAGLCIAGGIGALSYLGPNSKPTDSPNLKTTNTSSKSPGSQKSSEANALPAGFEPTIVNQTKPKG
ncbi:MAG: hypothetical protein ACKO9Q_00365, partial [Pirellula sp.]